MAQPTELTAHWGKECKCTPGMRRGQVTSEAEGGGRGAKVHKKYMVCFDVDCFSESRARDRVDNINEATRQSGGDSGGLATEGRGADKWSLRDWFLFLHRTKEKQSRALDSEAIHFGVEQQGTRTMGKEKHEIQECCGLSFTGLD